MPKSYLNPNTHEPWSQIVCLIVDGCYRVVDAHDTNFIGMLFADACSYFGIDIPDYITYALINTGEYDIKFRQLGGRITFYYKHIN